MKVHLCGVGGTGMASLAGLLKESGHLVTGSDEGIYPPMSLQLAEMGLSVRSPYASENVPRDADLVVMGNALSRGNPEVEEVLDRKQKMTSLPSLLGEEFLGRRTSLVVAGTHGKTTTTSLLAFLLERAGKDPSFLIGGAPLDFPRSYRLGGGEHFVIEGDEYDSAFFDKRPKFVHYCPDIVVLGNVEFDHADIYADLEAVQRAFLRLFSVIPGRGLLIAGAESPGLVEILGQAPCRVETFGVTGEAHWRAEGVRRDGGGSAFRMIRGEEDVGEYRLGLPGLHNVRNALAALAAATAAGVPLATLREALPEFSGVRRRFELRGERRGIRVYDDFAHHPTAVRETLRSVREAGPRGRLVAVFEPRSYTSRTNVFQEAFAEAFSIADDVLVARAFRPEKVPPNLRLSEEDLVRATRSRGSRARFVPSVGEIVSVLSQELQDGDLVVVFSNGAFGGLHEKLLSSLEPAGSGARPVV